jgi:N utilization substance protein A
VVNELRGEKIDVIRWSPDPGQYIANSLSPARVEMVRLVDPEGQHAHVLVPSDQLSLAIGREGQNVRLASALTGKQIDIMTEADESERRQKEFVEKSELFQTELDVDETLAQLLVAEGFSELEEVAYVDLAEIAGIEGFDEDLGTELQNRAIEALERRDAAAREERRGLGVSDDLAAIEGLTEAMLVTLGKKGVLTLDDLGDLATDELVGRSGILKDSGLSEDDGNRIIMAARAHWFADEEDASADGNQ